MADSRTRHDAAYSVTGKRKAPLAWLPWAGLLLLLLLAALVFLIVRNVGDDGDENGIDASDDPAAGADAATPGSSDLGAAGGAAPGAAGSPASTVETGAADAAPASVSAPTTAAAANPAGTAPAGAAPDEGSAALTAGGQAILPVPAGGLGSLAGQPVVGTAVPVESVVADEGFWVGTSGADRVFVVLTPEARTTDGESPFQVQPGQRVTIAGTLIALPGPPDTLGVDADEGADQLDQQGHLVEATQISLN